MSFTRLLSLCGLALCAGTAAAVVLLPEVPAIALGWQMPEPPFGALIFGLACAWVLLPGRASHRRAHGEHFDD